MKKKLLMIWLSVFLTTMLAFACTGDDDDDNDDAAADDDSADDDSADDDSADDDSADDDTTGDDDANDDDSADDDTTDDDADDDDDLTDYTREPVAVLTADARFVEIGDEVSFTGDGSSDPNGESLSFLLDFGDGDSIASANATHAYAAGGTFRARLTTTNETGYSDESEVLVTVGTPTTNNGSLDVIDFRPNHYNPIIIEPGDKPKHGGVIYGFFIAPDNAAPDTIKVNGNVYEPQTDGLQWCEVVPAQLLAGEIGIVRCHSYDNAFDAGDTVELEVLQGAVSLWQNTAPLPAPTLTPGYITANMQDDEILLHLRNDDDAPWTITGLKVNGADVSDFITVAQPTLAPGETSVIRLPQPNGVRLYEWLVFTVMHTDGKAVAEVSRALRLFPPVYPVGDWNSGSALESETELHKYLDVGIDMFIWGPSDSAPPETVLAWAETYDFYVFTHQGDVFDPLNPGHQYFRDFVAAYGDDPRILTNAVSGEGDLGDDPHEALGKIQAHRDLWGDAKPLWSYNACSYNFPAWAPLADMGGMDHYCVWAAQCNYNFPPFYWDRLENLGIYSEEIKLAAEPSPTWNWTQSIWNDFDINGNQVRCTTDDELRAQWYMVLSRGTKGVLWFYWRPDWSEDCPAEYTDEVLRVSRELAQLKETLLEGEMSLNGTIAYIEEEEAMIDVSATVSAESMVIFLQNLDYDLNLITPFQWREQSDIVIDVTPPDGFEPQQFRLVQDSGFVDLAWEKVAPGHWRFTLPTLSVAEAVLVIPEP